jgi:phosphatidylserine decarboxylase
MRELVFFNRYTESVEREDIWCGAWLRFAYGTIVGRLTLGGLFRRKIFSMILGKLASTAGSRRRIDPFIEKYGLRADSFEKKVSDFESFNDFFARKMKPSARPISPKPSTLSAPSDGRHLAYENINNLGPFFVKGEQISAGELAMDRKIGEKFSRGSILISRLCPVDYHRFHFPIDGVPAKTFMVSGSYASVNPIAMAGSVSTFLQNKRMSTILRTNTCGDILMTEIGATGVGSIRQTFVPGKSVLKGEEKGYFEYGGSTVISIFESGRVKFSEDVLKNTAHGMETYVLMGDEIATIA